MDSDFPRQDLRVHFVPGQLINTVDVEIIDDEEAEYSESFGVTLSDPEAGIVASPTNVGRITIFDDDCE